MVGEVLQIDADYHIMYTLILSIQNVVFFARVRRKRFLGGKSYFYYDHEVVIKISAPAF
jgi:hypothetical protein